MNLKTDIILGQRYRDSFTGLEGIATGLTFYVHGCERVTLEYIKDKEVKYESFDAPRLMHVDSNVAATTTRTGGPGGMEATPKPTPRR